MKRFDPPVPAYSEAQRKAWAQPSLFTRNGLRVRRRGVSTKEARACYAKYWREVRAGRYVRPTACTLCGARGVPLNAEHRNYQDWRPWAHACLPCHRKLEPAGGTEGSRK